VKGRLVPRAELTPAQRDAMVALLEEQFEGVRRDVFLADLAGKNWVLLLEDPVGGALLGFTTLHHHRARHRGREIQVLFSGDTVVRHEAAGSSTLSRTWIGAVNRLRGDDPAPLYWLLIVSGFRTYRFLPLHWRDYHPRCDGVPAPALAGLAADLASARFGPHYDPATGIVRLPAPQVLRGGARVIPANRLADPDVAFFVRANPGHEQGDELVCLTEVAWENLTPLGRRMWRGGEQLFPAGGPQP